MTADVDTGVAEEVDAAGRSGIARSPWPYMALGVVVRLAFVLAGDGSQRLVNRDSEAYLAIAARFPRVLWDPDRVGLVHSLQRPPGYPAFVWLVSLGGRLDPVISAVVAQVLVGGAVTVAGVWWIARRTWGPTVAAVAAAVIAIDPVSVGHSAQVGTETVFTAVLVIWWAFLVRGWRASGGVPEIWWYPALGGGLGLLALIRPVALYAAVPAAIVLAVAGRRRRRTALVGPAVLVVTAAVVAGSWIVRNDAVAGGAIFSSVQGHNLFDFGATAMAAEDGDLTIVTDPDESWSTLDRAGARLRSERADLFEGVNMSDPVNQERVWRAAGVDALLRHPRGAAMVSAAALVRGLGGPGHSLLGQLAGIGPRWLLGPAAAVLALELAGAAVGLVVAVRRGRRLLVVSAVGIAGYALLLSAGPQMDARFRVPVAPQLAVFAAIGLVHVGERVVGRARSRSGPEAAPVA